MDRRREILPEPLVMVVDGAPCPGRALEELLVEDGYRVVQVAAGSDAPRLAKRLNPALILLDLTGADVPALDAVRELRRCVVDAVIVVLSDLVTAAAARAAMLLGADDYVAKPCDINMLKLVLRDGLAERRRHADEYACAS